MGFFDLFRPAQRMEDPIFGTLRMGSGHAEGTVLFTPTGKQVEVLLALPETGALLPQQEFYQRLVQAYPSFASACAEMITTEFRNWREDFIIGDFAREFELVCISLPAGPGAEWSLAFTTEHDENHHFTVHFEGDAPTHVLIDG